jgi:hypothetical protein
MKRHTTQEFINEVKRRNPRCYMLNFKNTVYRGVNERVWFECHKHGEVSAIAGPLLKGRGGCPKCGWEKMAKKKAVIWEKQRRQRQADAIAELMVLVKRFGG